MCVCGCRKVGGGGGGVAIITIFAKLWRGRGLLTMKEVKHEQRKQ